jgi:hypothetical protein
LYVRGALVFGIMSWICMCIDLYDGIMIHCLYPCMFVSFCVRVHVT